MPLSRAAWCALPLAAAAVPALASDFSGFASGVLTFAVAVPLSVASLVLLLVFTVAGAYRSRRLAFWQAGLASLPPLLGAAATLLDSRAMGDEGVRWLANGVMLALAQLPVLVHGLRYGVADGR